MGSRPNHPRNQIDPGKRLLQLALRQAVSSKLSLVSQFKRELDKKKQERWKTKEKNCQDHALVPPEMAEILKEFDKHKVKIIEKKKEIQGNKVPKGRGRGKLISNQSTQSVSSCKNLEIQSSNPQFLNFTINVPKEKVAEDTKKIDEQKINVSTIENRTIQSNRIPKGRGRGRAKPSSNPGPTEAFSKSAEVSHHSSELHSLSNISSEKCNKVRNETVSESPIQLHHQFFSSNISRSLIFLQSDSMVTTCNEKFPLHSSDSCLLGSSSVHSFDLRPHKTTFPHMEGDNIPAKDSRSFHGAGSPSVSDLGYYSSSNLFISEDKFYNAIQTNDFDLQGKGNLLWHKSNEKYSSWASLNESGSKYSNMEKTKHFELQESKSMPIHDKWLTFATIQAPKPVAFVKAYTHEKITSPSVSNMNEEMVNHLLADSPQSCINSNSFSDLTENHKDLPFTYLNQFQSAMLLKNAFLDDDDEVSEQETFKVTSTSTYFHKHSEMEPEDKYIDELIESFIDKTKVSCNPKNACSDGSLIYKPKDTSELSFGDNTNHKCDLQSNYIDEFTSSFSDKSTDMCNLKDKYLNKLSPEDKYQDQVIDSLIDKTKDSCNSNDKYLDELIESFIDNTKYNPENNCADKMTDSFSDNFRAMCNIEDKYVDEADYPFMDKLIDSFINNKKSKCNPETNCIEKSIDLFSGKSMDMCNVEDKCRDESIDLAINNTKIKCNPSENCLDDSNSSFSDKYKDLFDPEEKYINELIESYFGKPEDENINNFYDLSEDMENKHVYDLLNSLMGENSNTLS